MRIERALHFWDPVFIAVPVLGRVILESKPVFYKLAASICLVLLCCAVSYGQCGCGSCSTGKSGNYGTKDFCGDSTDFDSEFFDCCRKNRFEYFPCDPCCRKPYISVFGGYSSLENLKTENVFPTTLNVIDDGTTVVDPGPPPVFSQFVAETTDVRREQGVNMLDGYGIGGTVGYRVHPLARLETEFSYRENQVESWFVNEYTTVNRYFDPSLTDGTVLFDGLTSSTVVDATGTVRSYSGMFNLLFDLTPRRIRCFNLYLGGGLGLTYVDGDISTATDDYRISSTSFSYQLIVGGNVPLTRRAEFFTEYKYLGADNLTIDNITSAVSLGNTGMDTHNVFLGIRLYPRGRGQ